MRLTAFASQIISWLHCSIILRCYPFACNVGARRDASRSGRFSPRHSTSQSKQNGSDMFWDAQAVKSTSNLNLVPRLGFEMRVTAFHYSKQKNDRIVWAAELRV